jgi:hypothetical protein
VDANVPQVSFIAATVLQSFNCLPQETMRAACALAIRKSVPLWIEPVSYDKAALVMSAEIIQHAFCIHPNLEELAVMATELGLHRYHFFYTFRNRLACDIMTPLCSARARPSAWATFTVWVMQSWPQRTSRLAPLVFDVFQSSHLASRISSSLWVLEAAASCPRILILSCFLRS